MILRTVMAGLWTPSGRVSTAFIRELIRDVPDDIREEFGANLVDLVHGLKRDGWSRSRIAARILRELKAATDCPEPLTHRNDNTP